MTVIESLKGVGMKKFILIFSLLSLVPLSAFGQSGDRQVAWRAYLFGAPGAISGEGDTSGIVHLGVGTDVDVYKGLGVEAEVGYIGILELAGLGNGCASINGRYSIGNGSSAKIVPFITGGRSWLTGSRTNVVNFGGGINYWIGKRFGLKFEFRDNFYTHNERVHILEGRIGLNFRLLGQ